MLFSEIAITNLYLTPSYNTDQLLMLTKFFYKVYTLIKIHLSFKFI